MKSKIDTQLQYDSPKQIITVRAVSPENPPLPESNGTAVVLCEHISEGSELSKESQDSAPGCCCCYQSCIAGLRRRRTPQKIVFVTSVVALLFLAVITVHSPWLLLYFFTVSYPPLMLVRLLYYIKKKWQYYLIDLCYFVNWAVFFYIWACPQLERYHAVVFSLAHGPVVLAVFPFRNSLVLHSLDKMTSCGLHLIPMLVTYAIRWYPEAVSGFWYRDINHSEVASLEGTELFTFMAIWLWAVPVACFTFHLLLYLFLLKVVFRPGPQYDYSYKFLAGERPNNESGGASFLSKMVSCCLGPKYKQVSYCLLTLAYGTLGVIYTPLLFHFYIANAAFIVIVIVCLAWNGACYYLDVFGPKQFI